ncbi:hypothetical protein AKJ16_DCAP14863, partial [Drosera capensis]
MVAMVGSLVDRGTRYLCLTTLAVSSTEAPRQSPFTGSAHTPLALALALIPNAEENSEANILASASSSIATALSSATIAFMK